MISTLAPCLNLKTKCNTKNTKVKSNGIKAGNKVKLSKKFPCINSKKDL